MNSIIDYRVSVIIASYNRFDNLLKAIESVKKQTYKNIEIIVVNDTSSDQRYYSLVEDGFKLIHLTQNTKQLFGFPCAGYVRRIGIEHSTGDYISILDDDDYFFDDKITIQLTVMHNSSFQMCASEALSGGGIYSTQKKYNMFHLCLNENFTKLFFLKYCGEYNASLPGIFNLDLISKHNFIVHSSTIFERKLYDLVGGYMNVQNGEEDYRLWLEMLKHTQCLYLNVPLLYYDARLPEPSILDFIRYIKLRLFNSFKKYQ